MCGITGIVAFNEIGRMHMIHLANATKCLEKRGPDSQGTYIDDKTGIGHRRLSIQDTSYNGNQPMSDETGRYTIVFNGEIYNYRALREEMMKDGDKFFSGTDTEVLLKLYIKEGKAMLDKLNGFYAFAIYDKLEKTTIVARDRFGIKPLFYYQDEDKIVFASELKSVLSFNIIKELDYTSIYQYLQFNYIPAPKTCLKNVNKLLPGHYIEIINKEVSIKQFYSLENAVESSADHELNSFEDYSKELRKRLISSVQQRLVSDVPLGSFLSGGIDSSIISAIASKYSQKFKTFSIGYKDNKFFDETKYADAVAKKHHTDHTSFMLSNKDLLAELENILDYIDEPFADSSCIPVYILSKLTSKEMKVALSGDGADELFGGYNKYMAEYKVEHPGFKEKLATSFDFLWKSLPQSRNSFLGNKVRQLNKFSEISKLSEKERYLRLCSYLMPNDVKNYFSPEATAKFNQQDFDNRQAEILKHFDSGSGIETVLRSDIDLVLQNDMLYKVDTMSMANGLEVRVPFLDHNVVELAHQMPTEYKIDGKMKKKVLQYAFKAELPEEVFNRPKKGFEVPLLDWFKTDLKGLIQDDLLADTFIEEQGIFNVDTIRKLKKQLFSNNPGDAHATVWALIVFQKWWRKNLA